VAAGITNITGRITLPVVLDHAPPMQVTARGYETYSAIITGWGDLDPDPPYEEKPPATHPSTPPQELTIKLKKP